MQLLRKIAPGLIFLAAVSAAQDNSLSQVSPGRKAPSITMSPAPVVNVTRGKPNTVNLRFHVGSGFHVNSNKPKSEFLIPTALR